jgi:CO dehydrogenase/acetyl-CoA synthase epsilon subunit
MFRAIGFVIIVYALSQMLSGAFHSFEAATIAIFDTVETAALVSQSQLEKANTQ